MDSKIMIGIIILLILLNNYVIYKSIKSKIDEKIGNLQNVINTIKDTITSLSEMNVLQDTLINDLDRNLNRNLNRTIRKSLKKPNVQDVINKTSIVTLPAVTKAMNKIPQIKELSPLDKLSKALNSKNLSVPDIKLPSKPAKQQAKPKTPQLPPAQAPVRPPAHPSAQQQAQPSAQQKAQS